jgi:aspartyl aminopeptidase
MADKKEKKTENELLQEKLAFKSEHAALKMDETALKAASDFAEGYKKFLDASKTEGDCVETILAMAAKNGYKEYVPGKTYKAGQKVYVKNRGAALMLATIGTAPLTDGLRVIASHVDAPRLDLKPNPLYEDTGIVYLKTHYYGGVRKYQWPTVPLALHGIVYKTNGESVRITIGEDENDPQFIITDLLPHLGREQSEKTLAKAFEGEDLNLIVGTLPTNDGKLKDQAKFTVLKILYEKYGITEADFHTADLKAVPAYKARDIGLDRSLIASYGHDDRVCVYTSMMADFAVKKPQRTTVTIFADKEEVGSAGNTGMASRFFQYFVDDLVTSDSVPSYRVFSNTKALSADVTAAYDPNFTSVFDKRNSYFINHGVGVAKYVGSGGKSGTVDASAAYMSFIRLMMDAEDIRWQVGEMGKIDAGGGGTVAKFLAEYDIDIVDIGVPVLAMHAPYELVSKIDVYMAYRAFVTFYK